MATISNNEIKIKYSLDTTDLANATALFDRLSAEDRQLLNDLKKLQAQLNATGQAGQAAGRSIGNGSNAARGSLTDLQNRVKDLTNRLNNLNPAASNYETILKRLQRAQANLSIATAQMNANLGKTQNTINSTSSAFSGLGSTLRGAFGVAAFLSFGKAVIDSTIKMDGLKKAIEFTSGSLEGGAANLEFITMITEKFGIPLEAAAEGFKTFSAAAGRAGYTVMQQRQMFIDLSKAMSALQLDSQSAGLVLFGFGQLMSKNKVSAQELYHQIGERLPIGMEAAQIAAAKITGQLKVTSGELIKLVEDGKLLSTDFAPAFTEALGKLAESGAYVETQGKNVNRLSNAWTNFKATLGDSAFLGSLIKVLTSVLKYMNGITEASNYLVENGFFPEIDFQTFKAVQKDAIHTFDIIQLAGEKSFENLSNINKSYQESLTDETETGILKRMALEAQYNLQRKQALEDLAIKIGIEEDNIARYKRNIETIKDKDARIYNYKLLKIAESAFASYKKLLGTIPELKTLLPDPDAEKKRVKSLEDEYRKIIAAIEARKTAEDDRIKASTRDGYTRDIKILQNNVKFNKEMLAIDESRRFKELELAKNNAVKRRGENERDNQEQINIRKKALDDALKIEQEYFKRTQDKLDENALKRRQSKQTELQNEIEDIKKNTEDQVKVLIEGLNKEIQVQEIKDSEREAIVTRYNNQITKIKQDSLNQQLHALQMYYDEQEKLDEQAAFDRNEIYIGAATRRLAADAKNEYDRQDILDQGALADITNNRNRLLADEKRLKTAYGLSEQYKEREAAMIKAKLTDLAAQEYEIQVNAEKRKQEKMLEIVQASADAMSQIFNDLGNLYISNLDREKEALSQKYDADVRLADGNKQKLAQLAQQKARAEYEIELKQFKARQIMAVAEVIFKTAPEIARWISTGVLAPVAAIGLAAQAFAIGAILAQPPPVPPYKDGTKGIPHPGGPALVGEAGTEKVITKDGQVYYTPPMATLVDLPKGTQVIPNHALSRKELFMANALNQGKPISPGDNLGPKLDRIGGILESLPVHQVNMNEKGFEKFVRTPRRTTKILNNQFPIKH
ncbi:hypothetical protein EB118_11585 [bacterium]|nr:hypothetical protein [bacterium]NDD84534.1 hypothetical protein [bacterium]NDG30700.1 hypothetical protein [bacterium]